MCALSGAAIEKCALEIPTAGMAEIGNSHAHVLRAKPSPPWEEREGQICLDLFSG